MTNRMQSVTHLTAKPLLSVLLLIGSCFTSGAGDPVAAAADRSPRAVVAVDASELPFYSQVNVSKKPTLQPQESSPVVGTYSLRNRQGRLCLKACLAVEYMVTENKKTSYFNINPTYTQATGYCGKQNAVLSLAFDGGDLQFTFFKVGNVYHVKKLSANLEPAPACKHCRSKSYRGVNDHDKLFQATNGLSFKCSSPMMLPLASDLRLKIAPMQIQAFDFTKEQFGKEFECWEDFTKRVIPIILGAVAVGLCLIATLVYLIIREHRGRGYEELP